jgi:sugar phosphate isomerase/epimerase
MKFSFMSFSCPELTLDQMLGVAKKFGYDGIEPRIDAEHKHGIEISASAAARNVAKRKAVDSGIALCCIATSCRFADPATSGQQVDLTLQCIDLAADVGAPVIRVFGGAFPESLSRESAIEVLAEALHSVADRALQRGVAVCLETHDSWCDPLHVAAVMRRVNHPAIAVNWDVMHPVRQANATIHQAFQALKPWIRHLHVHDGLKDKGELRPIGQGDIDHRRVVQLLKSAGYKGFLSGEWIDWDAYESVLPRELATLKSYETQG